MDQAEGLRRMAKPKPVRVIAVTSGKGGVGKTNVTVNLATAFAQLGRKAMIMDADLGLANVDVMLGLQSGSNLSHVMSGERTLEEIIMDAPGDIKIIPASSGIQAMAEMGPAEHAGLVRAFSELTLDVDVLLVDTAAGISDSVVSFSKAAQEVLVVVCDEPASITDAYALIKLLNRDHGIHRFHILANMAHSVQEGRDLFGKLVKVTDRFLDEVVLDYLGSVPYDDYLRKAVKKQQAVINAYPRSKAAQSFKQLAQKIDDWPKPTAADGFLSFFVERLVQSTPLDWGGLA
jgi:flagellar biosynthesis protein FlhG